MNIEEINHFINHIEKLNEKLSDQTSDFVKGNTDNIDQYNITITLDNRSIDIPFSADSYEILLSLFKEEINYLEGK